MLYIKEYVNRTRDLKKLDMLFVMINRPHLAAKPVTVSGWIKVINMSRQARSSGSVTSDLSSKAIS